MRTQLASGQAAGPSCPAEAGDGVNIHSDNLGGLGCDFCGAVNPGGLTGVDPKNLRHDNSMGAPAHTGDPDWMHVCKPCEPYVKWREMELKPLRRERFRCPTCYPITPEEATAIKLERESAGTRAILTDIQLDNVSLVNKSVNPDTVFRIKP